MKAARAISMVGICVLMLGIVTVLPAKAKVFRCFGKRATIIGTKHPDLLRGTPHADVIVGRGYWDTIKGKGGDDRICAGEGPDSVKGGRGTDRIKGGVDLDWLVGNRGDDYIKGGPGLDQLHGGGGNDDLRGGADSDWAVFGGPRHGRRITANLKEGEASGEGADLLRGIDRVDCNVYAVVECDVTGDSRANFITGGMGDFVARSGDGDDYLELAKHNDVATGRGDDSIRVGWQKACLGGDTLEAGLGVDSLTYPQGGGSAATIDLAAGTATYSAGCGDDIIANFENVTGTAFDDTIFGDADRNILRGYLGDDRLFGRGGDDYLNGDDSYDEDTDANNGGAGNDQCIDPTIAEGAVNCES